MKDGEDSFRWISPPMMIAGLLPSLAIAWILWLAPVEGLNGDRVAMALRDYTALWAAGKLASAGAFGTLADPAGFTNYIRELFGPGMPKQIWPYLPNILPLASTMAKLPLALGFALYSLFGVVALAASLETGRLRRRAILTVLLSPAVAANLLAGQNASLVAACACGGLFLLDRRPVVAGLLLGLLSLKIQFALLLPLCLLAGGRWQAVVAMGLSASCMAAMALFGFGIEPWTEFLAGNHTGITDQAAAAWQAAPAQSIFCSAFMAARSAGADLAVSYSCQLVATLLAAVLAWRLWSDRRLCPRRLVAATLPLALMAAPWVHNYDMPTLAVSVVLLAGDVSGWRRALVYLAWLWPGLSPLLPVLPLVSFASVASIAWIAVVNVRLHAVGPAIARSDLLSSA